MEPIRFFELVNSALVQRFRLENFYLGIFIVAAKRTAFGAFGKTLLNHSATDLAEIAARAALTR